MIFHWPAQKPESQGHSRRARRRRSAENIALGGYMNLDGTYNESFQKAIAKEPLPQPVNLFGRPVLPKLEANAPRYKKLGQQLRDNAIVKKRIPKGDDDSLATVIGTDAKGGNVFAPRGFEPVWDDDMETVIGHMDWQNGIAVPLGHDFPGEESLTDGTRNNTLFVSSEQAGQTQQAFVPVAPPPPIPVPVLPTPPLMPSDPIPDTPPSHAADPLSDTPQSEPSSDELNEPLPGFEISVDSKPQQTIYPDESEIWSKGAVMHIEAPDGNKYDIDVSGSRKQEIDRFTKAVADIKNPDLKTELGKVLGESDSRLGTGKGTKSNTSNIDTTGIYSDGLAHWQRLVKANGGDPSKVTPKKDGKLVYVGEDGTTIMLRYGASERSQDSGRRINSTAELHIEKSIANKGSKTGIHMIKIRYRSRE